jgi:hypothetical protein
MNTYALKIAGLKQLVGDDCIVGDVKIPNRYEPMLAQLQSSSGKFGLVAPTVKTQGTTDSRLAQFESLNDSIKSVITETINKNNNKNLDSIIKKNLRKYIG